MPLRMHSAIAITCTQCPRTQLYDKAQRLKTSPRSSNYFPAQRDRQVSEQTLPAKGIHFTDAGWPKSMENIHTTDTIVICPYSNPLVPTVLTRIGMVLPVTIVGRYALPILFHLHPASSPKLSNGQYGCRQRYPSPCLSFLFSATQSRTSNLIGGSLGCVLPGR